MAYVRDRFIDPTGVLATYDWQVNHSDEEDSEFRRNLERTSTTSGVGFVRQQGEDSPILIRWTGTALHKNQMATMIDYYNACKTRTIHLRDFEGYKYEVIVTDLNYKRVRTLRNPRDPSIPLHYYTYSINFEVINFLGVDMS